MKLFSFPLIAHYPLAGPPLPHTPPLHRETRPHPHLLAIQKIAHTSGEGGREYVSVQVSILIIISDPRRGCYIVSSTFIFFFFFFPPLLSGPYLWNRYSQRLQIECAVWSCGLILHYSLPSNSLRYFFILFFIHHDFVAAISLEPSLVETPD